jgi:hypothetical protein
MIWSDLGSVGSVGSVRICPTCGIDKPRLGRNETLLLEVLDDNRHSAFNVDFVCPDVDLGLGGGFVRRRDAGEVCAVASADESEVGATQRMRRSNAKRKEAGGGQWARV